jgi:hypothetical protein
MVMKGAHQGRIGVRASQARHADQDATAAPEAAADPEDDEAPRAARGLRRAPLQYAHHQAQGRARREPEGVDGQVGKLRFLQKRVIPYCA